jgi:hypothetical protein
MTLCMKFLYEFQYFLGYGTTNISIIFFPDVCYLRLDFETFTTIAPTVSTEATPSSCPDTFKITVSFDTFYNTTIQYCKIACKYLAPYKLIPVIFVLHADLYYSLTI